MSSTGYKVLGFAVWNGGKWYLRRTYRQRLPSARVSALAGLAATLGAGAVVGGVLRARRGSS
jgi:hypothetical protein